MSQNELAPDLHQATVDFATLAVSDQLAFEAGVWKLGPFKNHEGTVLSEHFLTITLRPENEEKQEYADGIEIRPHDAHKPGVTERFDVPPNVDQLWGAEKHVVHNPQSLSGGRTSLGAFGYFWRADEEWRTDNRNVEDASRLGTLAEEYTHRSAVIETVRQVGGRAVSEHLRTLDEVTGSFQGVTETFDTSGILEVLDYRYQSTTGDAGHLLRYGASLASVLQTLRIRDERAQ